MEPYWINSNGFGIYALRENPLFVSWNASGDQQLCLSSRFEYPYPTPISGEDDALSLRYTLCSADNVKAVHLLALSPTAGFWDRPRDIPDQRMFTDPIWSTWARFKTVIQCLFKFLLCIHQQIAMQMILIKSWCRRAECLSSPIRSASTASTTANWRLTTVGRRAMEISPLILSSSPTRKEWSIGSTVRYVLNQLHWMYA